MHDRRVEELSDACRAIGVDVRPESMGITWDDVDTSILGLADFVREVNLPYGIAHDFEPDRVFLDRLKRLVRGS